MNDWEKLEKIKKISESYFSILDHCEKCHICKEKMVQIIQHAIDSGDYKSVDS